jgi:hypothetical protein
MLYEGEKTKMHIQFCKETRSQKLMLQPKLTKEDSIEMDLK